MQQSPPRNPVLLIHGINDTGAVFFKMAPVLSALGWSVHDLSLTPNNGEIGLEELAGQVADYINRTFPPNQPIDIVGFSMGGIVSRYYVQRLGGINRVQRFITIASPHQGTVVAYLSERPGCIQMRPDSRLLDDLNRDVEMLDQIQFTSIWTPLDLMIIPASSSQLPVGREVIIPVAAHAWMLMDNRTIEVVTRALVEPFSPQPARQFEPTSIGLTMRATSSMRQASLLIKQNYVNASRTIANIPSRLKL